MFLQGRYPCCVLTKSKVVFKNYDPKQMLLLPPSLEELIEANHPVRVVDQVIERINIEPLLAAYQGGGTSSYHPRMMLKVVVFAYLSNIYSSRKIEAALKENILFMWISAMNKPDHNSINRFRSERLQKPLKEILYRSLNYWQQKNYWISENFTLMEQKSRPTPIDTHLCGAKASGAVVNALRSKSMSCGNMRNTLPVKN